MASSGRGLAILSGLLGGLGAAGQSLAGERERARKEREHQEELALKKKLFELQEAQAFVDPQEILAFFPPALRERMSGQLPSRVKASLVPSFGQLALKEQEREEEARRVGQFQRGLLPLQAVPEGTLVGPRTQPKLDPRLEQLIRLAPALQPKERSELLNTILFPSQEVVTGEPGRGIIRKQTGEQVGTVPFPSQGPFTPEPGTRPVVRRNPQTGETTITHEYPPQPSAATLYEAAVSNLEKVEALYPDPKHPERVKAEVRVNRLRPLTVPEGGFVGGPAGGPPLVTGPSKSASPGERDKLAMIDSNLAQIGRILGQVKRYPDLFGSAVSNPIGAGRRTLGKVIPGMLSSEERKVLAGLAFQTTKLKKDLIGATQTISELKGLVDALPDKGDIDESLVAKLEVIQEVLDGERQAITKRLKEARINVPSSPSEPAPKAPATMNPADQRLMDKLNKLRTLPRP